MPKEPMHVFDFRGLGPQAAAKLAEKALGIACELVRDGFIVKKENLNGVITVRYEPIRVPAKA